MQLVNLSKAQNYILVPGKWSPWSDWDNCTNSRHSRNRTCSNPEVPTFCQGPNKETVLCYDASPGKR